MEHHDVAVIGGGIIGLSTAAAVSRVAAGAAVVVVEKEDRLAAHQTGRNSGVIHTGLYYEPGSLKSRWCTEGRRLLLDFCSEQGIPVDMSGKVVVATSPAEMPALEELERRARGNGVEVSRIGPVELAGIEPHAAGVAALHVPGAAVVDFGEVAGSYAAIAEKGGASIRTGWQVTAARRESGGWRLETPQGPVRARVVVNCAGLHVDRVAALMGVTPDLSIVPFRGEYRQLRPDRSHLVKTLIYPVPDPSLPFLGVHFTRSADGRVEVGPNAVLAFAREGYRRRDVRLGDLGAVLRSPGFRKLARAKWRTGVGEMWRSVSPGAFAAEARKLVPELVEDDLGGFRAGVRAQAIAPDGTLVHDFALVDTDDAVHVLNAPSPAATASLAIGGHIAGLVTAKLA
jgi:L-2-hydroxyglutarate oxidase LhgO